MKDKIKEDKKAFAAIALLLGFWIIVPAVLQFYRGISAPIALLAITAVYYVGFKLWQKLS